MFAKGLKVFGVVAAIMGLMAIMGSANDCDGKCMETANDLPTMLMVIGYGLIAMVGGIAAYMAGQKIEDFS